MGTFDTGDVKPYAANHGELNDYAGVKVSEMVVNILESLDLKGINFRKKEAVGETVEETFMLTDKGCLQELMNFCMAYLDTGRVRAAEELSGVKWVTIRSRGCRWRIYEAALKAVQAGVYELGRAEVVEAVKTRAIHSESGARDAEVYMRAIGDKAFIPAHAAEQQDGCGGAARVVINVLPPPPQTPVTMIDMPTEPAKVFALPRGDRLDD